MSRIFSLLTISLLWPASLAGAEVLRYHGMCEASAAEAIDSTHFVVASDESNTLLIYERGSPEPIGEGLDLEDFLDADKSDLEGAAVAGNRIYWITSHSLNSDGDVKKKRFRFFATEITGGSGGASLEATGKPYKGLRDALVSDETLGAELEKASMIKPKVEGGFDIEGLAEAPQGGLFIGFRNPLIGGLALIVPLANPDKVVDGEDAVFGSAIMLPLGGRGIRSIERIGDHYLIIAGSWGDEADFALFRWDGPESGDPAEIQAGELADLNPEALFAFPGSSAVQILSDDGKEEIDGEDCEDQPVENQWFRSVEITP